MGAYIFYDHLKKTGQKREQPSSNRRQLSFQTKKPEINKKTTTTAMRKDEIGYKVAAVRRSSSEFIISSSRFPFRFSHSLSFPKGRPRTFSVPYIKNTE